MMNGWNAWLKPYSVVALLMATLLLGDPGALGGEIESRWDASPETDVRGYNVYAATSRAGLNSATPTFVNGRFTTTQTLSGLQDCTTWFVGVKAVDTSDLESLSFSDIVAGFPNPEPSAVAPNDGGSSDYARGDSRRIAINGDNFDGSDGLSPSQKVRFTHQQSGSTTGVTATQIVGIGCGQIIVDIQIASGAPLGAYRVTTFNRDDSDNAVSGEHVFGDLDNALTVTDSGPDTTPPTVQSVSPPAGSTDVDLAVNPSIGFSEAIDPTSVNASNVRLLDGQGTAVTQAAGSPQTSGSVVTIFPAQPLAPTTTYRVEVLAGGARDLAGNAIASTYTQNPGFTTQTEGGSNDPPDPPDPPQTDSNANVMDSSPHGGDFEVDPGITEVTVDFNVDMRPLFSVLERAELTRRFRVLSDQTSLVHSNDSPRVSADGFTVIMSFAETLRPGDAYSTFVDLSGEELQRALDARGMGYYLMPSPWQTRPHWRMAGAVDEIGYRDGSSDTPMAPQGSAATESNSNVPVDAVFFVRFDHPVVPSTLTDAVFSVSVQVGRRYQTVDLSSITTEDGGRTVILRPAQNMPAGSMGQVSVRTGPNGVQIDENGTPRPLRGGSPIQASFSTEVSGSSLSLGVGE